MEYENKTMEKLERTLFSGTDLVWVVSYFDDEKDYYFCIDKEYIDNYDFEKLKENFNFRNIKIDKINPVTNRTFFFLKDAEMKNWIMKKVFNDINLLFENEETKPKYLTFHRSGFSINFENKLNLKLKLIESLEFIFDKKISSISDYRLEFF